jgi:signal transduction histidine kinase
MIAGLRLNLIAGTAFWLLVVVVIGLIDLSTGPDYGFGNFYLLAVLPAAWLLGRQPGIAIALASGFTWFFVDLLERRTTSLGPILWNGTSRVLVFVLAAILIDLVRRERERMRALDRERSQFMRVLEHELAGPGQELSRGLRTLQRSGGATAEQLQPLVERAQDLEFLSRDFVSLGKLQSGELWLQHRAIDLAALVEELRTRSTATEPRIPLTLSSGAFVVEGDEARLRQAIGSLLTEARAAQTPDVSIDLRRDGPNAKLTITGGVGPFIPMDPDDRGGVGVELARVIIHAHRGQLEHFRSAASKAARFVVELPLE